MIWVNLVAGCALLLIGGELLVRSGVGLARHLNVSPLLVGLTVVGFGTSTPELITSLRAGIAGSPGIALGNVVGSNIANVLFILGLAALIRPLVTTSGAFRRDGLFLAGSTLVLGAAAFTIGLGRGTGGGFLVLLGAYVLWVYLSERGGPGPAGKVLIEESEVFAAPRLGPVPNAFLLIASLGALLAGATLLVGGARQLAVIMGASEAVIGLTVVAVGTSLPELVISVLAALRGHGDVALGNIVGSNIFNILGILGVVSLVTPLVAPSEILERDLWVLMGVTALLLLFAWTGWRLTRGEGMAFLAAYGAYLGLGLAG